MPTVAAQVKDAKQLLDGKFGEEEAALVGFALVQEMNGKGTRKQFDGLLRALRKGDSFEQAMSKTFGPPKLSSMRGSERDSRLSLRESSANVFHARSLTFLASRVSGWHALETRGTSV